MSSKEIAELRKNHDLRLKVTRMGFDPYYKSVPDSMKKWIGIFSNVLADDQKNRITGLNMMTKAEANEQNALDSVNLKIVSGFIDKYGWPAKYDAGFKAQTAIAMVIQHAPLKIQEKYYPYLVEAFKRDRFLFEYLALLEDRINVRNNRLQYYGTESVMLEGKMILYPVVNIDSIDIYRNRLGPFMPVKDYMALLKVDWNAEDYKTKLPEFQKKLHVSDTLGLHYSN